VFIGVKSYTKGCFVTVLGKNTLEVMRNNIGQSIELLLLLLLLSSSSSSLSSSSSSSLSSSSSFLFVLFEFKLKEWHPSLNYFSSLI
jgi:hypothetical protein